MRPALMTSMNYQGIVKVLKGVLQYRALYRREMVNQFEQIRDDPHGVIRALKGVLGYTAGYKREMEIKVECYKYGYDPYPDAVFFTCMDSRMLPTRFTQTNVGDMFIVRNAGNLIPHAGLYDPMASTTEPAALELGCIVNNIKDIVVCGHSDCKAMNLLHELRDPEVASITNQRLSPLKAWLCRHAKKSLHKFEVFTKQELKGSLEFSSEIPQRRFVGYIDPEDKFSITDKLSQINTLQQVENIASYSFLRPGLEDGSIHIHALWFDIYTGNIYYFSRRQKCFIEIREDTVGRLIDEVTS